MTKERKSTRRRIVENRKARFEFEFIETFEAGVELQGTEVKSLRDGRVHFADAYATIERGEMWLYHVNIAPYPPASQFNHEPMRKRRLLLHRRELDRLEHKIREQGLTLVPTELYWSGRNIKVELALARGKKLHDKRETIKARESQREIARAMK
jgi:SsrA-binding protein